MKLKKNYLVDIKKTQLQKNNLKNMKNCIRKIENIIC